MAADAERRRCARYLNCLIGGGSACHERGAGDQASLVKFEDGAVDPLGLAKVVSIDDEAGHRIDGYTDCALSSSTSRNFSGFIL